MTVEAIAQQVVAKLDLDRAVELSREVCRIPSVLGEERELAAFLASTMSQSGFESVELQPVLPNRPNAIGELSFGSGRRVVLTGHMDTKPVSRGWTRCEPFSGDLIDGRVYGHGIMDMKAALAAMIVALEAVRDCGLPLAGTVGFAGVSDHMGDQLGSIAYFKDHDADFCLLGELSDNEIFIGHRGRYYFDVVTQGRSAHTCDKYLAVNANVLASHAVLELHASKLEPELEPWARDLFGPETMIAPGRIYGGLPPGGPSMIPDECVIRVDCRPQPGVPVDVVRAEIDRCLAAAAEHDPDFDARVELADVKAGHLISADAPVVQTLVDAVRYVKRAEPELKAAGWLGDTASFGQEIPTVIFGPGHEPVYCADEHLSIEDIHVATTVYAVFTALSLTDASAL